MFRDAPTDRFDGERFRIKPGFHFFPFERGGNRSARTRPDRIRRDQRLSAAILITVEIDFSLAFARASLKTRDFRQPLMNDGGDEPCEQQ